MGPTQSAQSVKLLVDCDDMPDALRSYVGAFALVAAFGPRGMLQSWLEPLGIDCLPSIYGFPGALLAGDAYPRLCAGWSVLFSFGWHGSRLLRPDLLGTTSCCQSWHSYGWRMSGPIFLGGHWEGDLSKANWLRQSVQAKVGRASGAECSAFFFLESDGFGLIRHSFWTAPASFRSYIGPVFPGSSGGRFCLQP